MEVIARATITAKTAGTPTHASARVNGARTMTLAAKTGTGGTASVTLRANVRTIITAKTAGTPTHASARASGAGTMTLAATTGTGRRAHAVTESWCKFSI
ncbi:hypothetical protein PENARI_c132G01664 [Penicillium arizonense]|uniref:Uncharacterized protein n=1 Tax=Penicillium arizonense TaxID=1835702 RepID=A0A1F5L0G2_PENAI|nr:hypothetical protein PENARI_c132G01664 [Penicillium arizonense]OGE46703.1 hypothetical protein PENARI_c132G01664 [Penicillium arizonense]